MKRLAGLAIVLLLSCELPASAHQLVVSAGYANSGKPEVPSGESQHIVDAGGGYAFGARVDLERKHLWFGPAFTFWNNLTGDPTSDVNASYLQAEFGGRISLRTHTMPALYGGVGLGYTFSHAEYVPRFFGARETYDGEFATASVHLGAKTPSRTNGLGFVGEVAYSFGLNKASGENSIGPANAFLVQIGVALDIQRSSQP